MSNLDPNQVPPTSEQATQAGAGAAAGAPHRPPDDVEETYYDGSPLLRGALGKSVWWLLLGAVLIALTIAAAALKWHWPWWVDLAVLLVGVIIILIPIIRTKSIRYRITNYRIDHERGFLSKDIDTLELWHVEDICFHQSLLDRMMGVGDITVISHDDTMPLLKMIGIPNPRPLFEQLKQRVIAVKRQRGVIKMDPG